MSYNGNAEAGPSRNGRRDSFDSDTEDRKKPMLPEDPDAAVYTVENFQNVPIQDDEFLKPLRTAKGKIQTLIARIEKGVLLARDTASAVEQASPDDKMIDEIQDAMLKSLDEKKILNLRIEAIDNVIRIMRTGEIIPDLYAAYEEKADGLTRAYMAQTKRMRFKNDEALMDFRQVVWEVNNQGAACPPLTRWLPKEDGDESDDEEFEIGGTLETFKCPMTMTTFSDAAKSTTCGHHYNYDAIIGHIRSAKKSRGQRRPICPVAGCQSVLAETDIIRDPAMQRRAEDHARRQREREDNDEDEGDIINLDD